MTLHDCLERVVVISLPFRTERRERLRANMRETGVADPDRVVWQDAICGDWMPAPAWWGQGNGAWGCLLSHLRVAQDAMLDNVESYCVLEDDCVWHESARDILQAFWPNVPSDWEQVYLGGQHRKLPTAVPGHPFVMRAASVNRTHAFALHRTCFGRFASHIMHFPDYVDREGKSNGFHIDHQLERAHQRKDWPVYAPFWWPCGQEAGESNISGRNNARMWWQPYPHAKSLPVAVVPPGAGADLCAAADEHCHFGYNLMPGGREDAGVARAVRSDEALAAHLTLIAEEAIARWRLPAISHPSLTAERLARVWRPGTLSSAPEIHQAARYPQNGLIPAVPPLPIS